LSQAERVIGPIPAGRWNQEAFYDPAGGVGRTNVSVGGFLEGVDRFDAAFFGIAPREAAKMDPQQRLLLEVTWEALEHAGLAPDQLTGSSTGVFIGIGAADYAKVPLSLDDYYGQIDAHSGTGNALSIAANRISYLFDWHGPSLSIDTACSSSLVALHAAAQSLHDGESELAVAGGVNLILAPEAMIAFSNARMLSPDGHCRPFDARANGYVRGEGVGLVVLKRLTDAVAAGLVDELGSLTDAINLARRQAGIANDDKVLLVESPRSGVSSLRDLLYLVDVEGAQALVFNREQYLMDLVEHRGQPMVLLPYHYFDRALLQ
jgi:acyl transferase domain-containing protein